MIKPYKADPLKIIAKGDTPSDAYILKCIKNKVYDIWSDGKVYNRVTKRYVGFMHDKDKYCNITRQKYSVKKHKVIWMAFKGDVPKGYELNHIDGRKQNNAIWNLEVVTASGNMSHAIRMDLRNTAAGERAGKAIFSNKEIADMRKMCNSLEGKAREAKIERIADVYETTRLTIRRILRGETYKTAGGPIREHKPMRRETTNNDLKRISKLDSQGHTRAEIATALGIRWCVVNRHLRAMKRSQHA